MKQVIYSPTEDITSWVAERIPHCSFREDARAIGITRDGELAGGVVFDTFSSDSCFISVAGDGTRTWLNREFILRVFAYPFVQLNHRRITAVINEHNAASRQFCEGFGFHREGTLREGAADGADLLIYGLLARECRFLPHSFTGHTGRNIL